MRLVLNGRFMTRPMTGVERLALELGAAIAQLLPSLGSAAPAFAVVTPSGVVTGSAYVPLEAVAPVRSVGRFKGQLWEQLDLPRHDPAAWLLDFCNLGPVARRRQALIVCDSQIYRQPQSYRRSFRTWYRLLLPLLGRRVDALFTISHHSQRELEDVRAFPPGKSHVLRLGVDHIDRIVPDPGVLSRHGLIGGTYFLAIGSLAPHKNLAMLTRAFIDAGLGNDTPLVVAGGGNERVFADAGLPQDHTIRYLGRVTDEELRSLYENALAFVSPALTEGFGLTPLEAMACGCPVIATTGGAVPEICGDAALYADPLQQDAWIETMRRMAQNSALRERMATIARDHAATYRWRDAAIGLLRILALHDHDHALVAQLDRLRGATNVAATAIT